LSTSQKKQHCKNKGTYIYNYKKLLKESQGKKILVPEKKIVHMQNDNLMDMLKASLGTKNNKTA
jgi:hypothetical protein